MASLQVSRSTLNLKEGQAERRSFTVRFTGNEVPTHDIRVFITDNAPDFTDIHEDDQDFISNDRLLFVHGGRVDREMDFEDDESNTRQTVEVYAQQDANSAVEIITVTFTSESDDPVFNGLTDTMVVTVRETIYNISIEKLSAAEAFNLIDYNRLDPKSVVLRIRPNADGREFLIAMV